MVQILYPERRTVSEETVIGWAQDSLVNAVITRKVYASDAEFDAEVQSIQQSPEYTSMGIAEAMATLEHSGEVTFAKAGAS